MLTQEQIEKVEEIYNDAIQKLAVIDAEAQEIIKNYIKELEQQKMNLLREGVASAFKK